MKRILYGKDIFDAAFSHVKNILLEKRTTQESVKLHQEISKLSDKNPEKSTETRERTETALPESAPLEVREGLEERFPFILASVCAELGTLDKEYRRSEGEGEQEEYSEFFIGLDDVFPLCDKFSFPCAMYVCSMFMIDSDSEVSDKFFERYSDAVSEISSKIAWDLSTTTQKYPN